MLLRDVCYGLCIVSSLYKYIRMWRIHRAYMYSNQWKILRLMASRLRVSTFSFSKWKWETCVVKYSHLIGWAAMTSHSRRDWRLTDTRRLETTETRGRPLLPSLTLKTPTTAVTPHLLHNTTRENPTSTQVARKDSARHSLPPLRHEPSRRCWDCA